MGRHRHEHEHEQPGHRKKVFGFDGVRSDQREDDFGPLNPAWRRTWKKASRSEQAAITGVLHLHLPESSLPANVSFI